MRTGNQADMKVSIIVFEINEIDGMRLMMPQIKKEWYDELIVIDGGSTDGTVEYCKEHGYTIYRQTQKGPGGALNEAARLVTGDIVILYAPDGSFLVEPIPEMIAKIKEGYDIVNVSRYGFGAHSDDDTFFTGTANWLFTRMVNLFFGRWFIFTDFLYTYVAYRRELVEETHTDTDDITWAHTMMLRAIKRGKKIIEMPSVEPKRVGGDVKVSNKVGAAWVIARTIIMERFRPIR
jgi:glycosyltransferase involved in cell wall biosynthesis